MLLTSLVTPALFTDENLRCLVIGRMVNLSLEHGNSDASCYAYSAVGNVLGLTFGDYQARVPLSASSGSTLRSSREWTA